MRNWFAVLVGVSLALLAGGCRTDRELDPSDVRRFFRDRSITLSERPHGSEVKEAVRELIGEAKEMGEVCERLRLKEVSEFREEGREGEASLVRDDGVLVFFLSRHDRGSVFWTRYTVMIDFDDKGEVRIVVAKVVGGSELKLE